jgi:hypothetical protein
MFKYLPEFLVRTLRHWIFLIGFLLDVLTLVVLLIADASQLGLAWPYLLLGLAAAVVIAAFFVFQEERHKNEPRLEIQTVRPHRDADSIFANYEERGLLHWWVPLRIRVLNHDPTGDARIIITKLTWEQMRLFRTARHLRDIPLVDVDGESRSEIEIPISHAARSPEFELLFEDSWSARPETIPRRSCLLLRPETMGSPDVELEITKLDNP